MPRSVRAWPLPVTSTARAPPLIASARRVAAAKRASRRRCDSTIAAATGRGSWLQRATIISSSISACTSRAWRM